MAWWNLRHPVETARRARILPAWVRRLDHRTAAHVNGRRTLTVVDRGYALLSTAANHGLLWFAIAAVLVVTGRRRAAVRGVLSLAAASATANLVGKQLFGGDRPALASVPLRRRLRTTPTSGSFPSGHSASAAAFAAGVAAESPAVGAAVAPLAGAVAYSRMHTGAHWLSDVIAGVGIGLSVAGLGTLVVPARQVRESGPVGAGTARDGLPTSSDGSDVFIVVNTASGRRSESARITDVLRDRLPHAVIQELREGEDVAEVVAAALAAHPRPGVLGVCGGDGTVACVAAAARAAALPLLVVPGGTFNHFAKAVGSSTVDASIEALAAGTGLVVDVAELRVAEEPAVTVLNTMSIGLYPEFVQRREPIKRRWGKPLATLLSAVGILRNADPVVLSTRGATGRAWSLFVGVDNYAPGGSAAPLRRIGIDDGVLDVRILRAGARQRTRGAAALILGARSDRLLHAMSLWSPRASIDAFSASELRVTAHATGDDGAPGYAHDGEARDAPPTGGRPYPVTVTLVRRGLTVYSPSERMTRDRA